ncbi:MAG TPA: hypothetical protein VE130_10035 [Nitrososphaeraceae archaeon]|nr:hypothetical protein [Nitrososphaeraceae archaeon]
MCSLAQRPSVVDNIGDWRLIVDSRREATTSDQALCGRVVAEFRDAIIVLKFGRYQTNKFLVPKSEVEGFDGAHVRLKIPQMSLLSFCY